MNTIKKANTHPNKQQLDPSSEMQLLQEVLRPDKCGNRKQIIQSNCGLLSGSHTEPQNDSDDYENRQNGTSSNDFSSSGIGEPWAGVRFKHRHICFGIQVSCRTNEVVGRRSSKGAIGGCLEWKYNRCPGKGVFAV